MNGLLLLFLISGSASKTWRTTTGDDDDDTARYCRICPDHTMCRFPYDEPGFNCVEVSSVDLDDLEIEWLLLRHNSLRKASGGDAKIIWDDELARIARRWALQCGLHETDSCRDVGRFTVLQQVNAMELTDPMDIRTSLQRLAFHVSTWSEKLAAYGKASTSRQVTRLGCARAIYSVDFGVELPWVETLVCNYGPIEATTDVQLVSRETKGAKLQKDELPRSNATASAVRIGATTTTTTISHRLLLLAGYLFLLFDRQRLLSSFLQPGLLLRNSLSSGGIQTWT